MGAEAASIWVQAACAGEEVMIMRALLSTPLLFLYDQCWPVRVDE